MNSYKPKVVSIIMAATMLLSLFTGCGNNSGTSSASSSNSVQSGSSTTASTTASTTSTAVYPIKTTEKLKFWCELNASTATFGKSFGDVPFGKELEKKTGVQIEYIHPAAGQTADQFNILIASGDLPDMIEYNWAQYPGGPAKALSSNVIVPLNDLISKDSPNLRKILDSDNELNRMVKTDNGKYYVYPALRNQYAMVFGGLILRQDWLDKLGLQVPETIDEYYNVLKEFKTKMNASLGMLISFDKVKGPTLGEAFAGAYKTSFGYFVDDNGKVQYGPSLPQYKDLLSVFKKWYSEGLIDKEFAVQGANWDNKVLSNKTGLWFGYLSGSLRKFTDLLKKNDPNAKLVGAKYPVLNKGETPFLGQSDFKYFTAYSTAITTACKNKDLAAKWLDYAYSPEGNLLYNFGIEGESYTMVDGVPKFTDLIMKNPEGLSTTQILGKYVKSNGAFRMDENYQLQIQLSVPYMRSAYDGWSKTDARKHILPPFITPTEENVKQLSTIVTDIDTYKSEMFVKFVMGIEPIENFDLYIAQLKKIGVDNAVKIYQTAFDSYQKR